MKPKNTIILLALACTFATGARAQNISLPTSKAETDARIAAKAQLTSAPTVYIWMLDAELEYDKNNKPTNPKEYKNTTGDKNDNYYLIKKKNSTSFDTQISNNIIKKQPNITNDAKLLPNYGFDPDKGEYGEYYFTSWTEKPKDYRLARIKIVDNSGGIQERDELTTIRGRGNSTWECNKKSYRLKFPSKVKLLAKADGTNEYAEAKSWTLLANAADRTMLRNALTSQVIGSRYERKTGVNALPFFPACKFVDLVLNNIYIGTYQISDHVQIQKERINIDEDNGWLVEGVSTEDKFIEDPNIVFNGIDRLYFSLNVKNPEDKYYTDDVATAIRSYFTTILNFRNPPYDFSEATGLFKYVDMESAVQYFIGTEVSGNYDGLISNYVYRDINPGDKLKLGPLWDSDIAYGNFNNFGRSDLVNDFVFNQGKKIDENTIPLAQLVKAMVENSPEFVNLLVKRWDQVYSKQTGVRHGNGLSNHLEDRIKEMVEAIYDSQKLNYTLIKDGGAGWDLWEPIMFWVGGRYTSYEAAVNDLKDYIYGLEGDNYNNYDRVNKLNNKIQQLKQNMKASDYTHDATSTATSLGNHAGKICKATIINRTFTVGEWNTICLPFSLTKDELQAKFGDDVVLMEYKSIVNGQMLFAEVADKRLVAGIPYLIKPSKVEALEFDEVALSCPNPATISYTDNPAYAFKGTYFMTSIAADGTTMLLDAANEQFKANSSVSSLDGCSAYIVCPAGTTTVPIFSTISLPDDQDNTALLADLSGKTIDLTLTDRTFYHDGSWNTLCLPFDIDDITGTPLEGATVMKFEEKQTSFSGSTLTIGFSEPNSVKAGKPYLVKWTDGAGEVKDPTFRNVTISATEPGSYEAADVFMLGTFSPVKLEAGDTKKLYLGGGNTLYYPQTDVSVNACRAYFELQGELTAGDVDSQNLVRSCVLNFDGQETAISEIYSVTKASAVDNSWYTLDGRRLSSEPTAPGIYVNRGRKIVIK